MTKILLDTDIGSDIDDALALTYLLSKQECELVGITTVSGQPELRAQLSDAICKHFNRNIPIYSGLSEPILVSQNQPESPQAARLTEWAHGQDFPTGAVNFLADMILKHPNELTIMAIGPLTNIAGLFITRPEVIPLIKEVILMSGYFFHADKPSDQVYAEWNVKCDPHASAVVYNAPLKKLRIYGLDVTTKLVLPEEEAKQQLCADAFKPAVDFASVWFRHCKDIVFHDPLSAVSAFKTVCTYKRGKATVCLDADRLGITTIEECADGNTLVAETVDRDAFFAEYLGVIGDARV